MAVRWDRSARILVILIGFGGALGALGLALAQWRRSGVLSPALLLSSPVYAALPFLLRNLRRS